MEWTYKVYVDGANVGARFCGPKDYAKFDAVIVSQDTSKPLVFGHLNMTGKFSAKLYIILMRQTRY